MNRVWPSSWDYDGDWCAHFVSWLLRGTTTKEQESSAKLYGELPHVSSPKAGDVIHDTQGHVGLVVSTSGGLHTIEGNAGSDVTYKTSHVKAYSTPWSSSVEYCRPTYK